ncbi:DUF1127 domain-containing protein [Azospirillum sp. RWY-5-1]|uniref:DUF1127 domain-containing protein n=1 Tax=Azospirillum oleiclasticum TaxID=2735135 RepID=A0ABX2TKG0_9PROT|nr:DUF1127 domain-containing protein [Azospirillum oleiclasticum]NYZ15952.1 DUF1127 domain-containing protein [Azospirillum oleiclasticum]NYZ23569.1 DUF1127 domain-containing protein [Azospirillum oleiclasticum]
MTTGEGAATMTQPMNRAWGIGAETGAGRGWRTLRAILVRWLERRRQRLALRDLDHHLLRDIGISRSDARREGRKPFWR